MLPLRSHPQGSTRTMPKISRQKSTDLPADAGAAEERRGERLEEHVSGTLPIASPVDEALHRARESFRALAHVSPELVLVYRDERVVEVNPSAARALALSSPDDVAGLPLEEIFLPDGR